DRGHGELGRLRAAAGCCALARPAHGRRLRRLRAEASGFCDRLTPPCLAEALIQTVEHRARLFYARVVVALPGANAGDDMRNADRLLAHELAILEIDVVNDLCDGRERGVVQPRAFQEHFEGALVAFMRDLALEHVEADLGRFRPVVLFRDELELGRRIDEAPDHPGTGDPVDMDVAPRDPNLAFQL